MFGWLMLLVAGVALLGLAGLLSRWFGRSRMDVHRSASYHIGENEIWYRRPY